MPDLEECLTRIDEENNRVRIRDILVEAAKKSYRVREALMDVVMEFTEDSRTLLNDFVTRCNLDANREEKTPPYRVRVTYYKPKGKYYSQLWYQTHEKSMHAILDEVKKEKMHKYGDDEWFIAVVDVFEHPTYFPMMVMRP